MEQIVPAVGGLQFPGKFPEPFVDSIHPGKADVWFVKRIQQRLKNADDGAVVDEMVISIQIAEGFLQASTFAIRGQSSSDLYSQFRTRLWSCLIQTAC